MQPTDFENICLLWKKINVQSESIMQDRDNFALMLQLNPSTCFVIEENAKIIGSIFGLFNGRRAWIYHLGIHPDSQDKNLGAKLLQLAEKSLKERGAKRVLLWVEFKNLKVASFYEKSGYLASCDAILMGKDI